MNNGNTNKDLTFVDLFCGCGGLSKGLEMAGFKGICALDFFREAGQTYKANFGHPFILGDITLQDVKNSLYDTVHSQLAGRQLTLVAGGFPCQGFSLAGLRQADDARNKLYLEMLDVVDTLKPEFVLCENVKGICSMEQGKVVQRIVADYRSIGYDMQFKTLNAADYGTAQLRERVIFIGNRIGKLNIFPKPIVQEDQRTTVKDAIFDLMSIPYSASFNHIPTIHRKDVVERLLNVPQGEGMYENYKGSWRRLYWEKPSWTIKENHGQSYVHPELPRVLTVRECARLQSFPDSFLFSGSKAKQYVQIGNAVPPLLAKAVGLSIRDSLES